MCQFQKGRFDTTPTKSSSDLLALSFVGPSVDVDFD